MSNIADKPGKYTSFTGIIKYRETNCNVIDATFELMERFKRHKGGHQIWIDF